MGAFPAQKGKLLLCMEVGMHRPKCRSREGGGDICTYIQDTA